MTCKLYSVECGADAWLEFDEADPPEYRALNGKCVVIIKRFPHLSMVEVDEFDPLADGMLLVNESKLRYDNKTTTRVRAEALKLTKDPE